MQQIEKTKDFLILSDNFFSRPVLVVAQDLLGKYLVRKIDGKEYALQINEVEAYDGPNDKASHGRFGQTKRTHVMFGPAGKFYVYLVYGMHWMLNIVTDVEGYPAAILIRGAGRICGPARITKFLSINKSLDNQLAQQECGLWFEDRQQIISAGDIVRTARIGIDYAGSIWSKKPFRFILQRKQQ